MPGLLSENNILRRTFIFKMLVIAYDNYNLWRLYRKTKRGIKSIPKDVKNFFIFPFYHTGGAEKVHADIVSVLKSKKQVVFFTLPSANDQYKHIFEQHAQCFELYPLLREKKYKSKILTALASRLNRKPGNVVFSSHSEIFYSDILPTICDKNTCIDLIHAFVHPGEPGAEYWSLPVVNKLHHRVTICKTVKNMLIDFYAQNNVDASYGDKIEVIYNAIDLPERKTFINKPQKPFKVIFVGRNSPEKRIDLIMEVAQEVTRGNNIEFYFIGPGISLLDKQGNDKIILVDNVSKSELQEYYEQAHMIILLSSREGLPVVLLEAMNHGVVPVATNVGGVSEVITDENGFLITSSSLNTIKQSSVDSVLSIYLNNIVFIKKSSNCLNSSKEMFSMKTFKDSYDQIINK